MRTVARTRYWIRLAWRVMTVLLVLGALWTTRHGIQNLFTSLFEEGMSPLSYIRYYIVDISPYVLIAAAMLILERFIVRWLVPLSVNGCARCGYPATGRAGACPECGLDTGQ
jgi:hypothetical protein